MKLTIQSKQNAQTIVDLFNAIITGECETQGVKPLSIYDEDKHICSITDALGNQILELIIEREQGDKLCPVSEPINREEELK
jgi:hypothetical protein